MVSWNWIICESTVVKFSTVCTLWGTTSSKCTACARGGVQSSVNYIFFKGGRGESVGFTAYLYIILLSDRNKILNNEQIDNGIPLKSKPITQKTLYFLKKMKWIIMHEFVTSFIILQWKDSYDLIGDWKVKLSGSPKTFLCIKTSEKNDN